MCMCMYIYKHSYIYIEIYMYVHIIVCVNKHAHSMHLYVWSEICHILKHICTCMSLALSGSRRHSKHSCSPTMWAFQLHGRIHVLRVSGPGVQACVDVC